MHDEEYIEDESTYEGVADMEEDESYYTKSQDDDDDLEKEYSKFFETQEEQEDKDVEYEFDSVVGARDKKPVMNVLNKTKLTKMEMDELFNEY